MPGNKRGRPRLVERVAPTYPDRVKVCPSCLREKPWAAFYPRLRWECGVLVRAVRSRCKLCESTLAEVRWQVLAETDRTALNAARRAYHQRRMMTDPEYAERFRRIQRENRRLRYQTDPEYRAEIIRRSAAFSASPRGRALERKRRAKAARERAAETSMRLPSGPWREWLEEQRRRFPGGDRGRCEMAAWLGVDESGLRRWLDGTTGVRLDTADAVLCKIGQPHLLMLLWPDELYQEDEAA